MINKTDLSGIWAFRLDKNCSGINSEFFNTVPDDTITLPSTTSQQHKGSPNPKAEQGFLTDEFAFEGFAWYYKNISLGNEITGRKTELFLERTRMTRLWINGCFAGEQTSLCSPHIYDISEYIKPGENRICVLVSNKDYPTKGGHMTSPDTQSNWNGITGEISLIFSEKDGLSNVKAYPDATDKTVTLFFSNVNSEKNIQIWGSSDSGQIIDSKIYTVSPDHPFAVVDLGENAQLWSEYSPVVYTLKAAVSGSNDILTVSFGLRNISSEGLDIKLNGNKIFLRGRHDGLIFPKTGAAPTDLEDWYVYLSKVKEWGLNHVRFHTCCPPEAAFKAADMLGIYLQPELPFWGTIAAPGDEGFNETEQDYLINEGLRILDTFGDHPSFLMMSLGNELWGSPERLNSIISRFKSFDNRHLYTQGSNNFQFYPNIQPEDDFFSGVRLSRERLIRGSYASCDAPLGFVQTSQPCTSHSYDKLIFPETSEEHSSDSCSEIEIQYGTGVKKVKVSANSSGLIPTKPIVTHEVGQYCSFPDLDEINQYSGPLKPRSLEIIKNRLSQNNLLSQAEKIHLSSGMLAFDCYKLEIEAALRSEYISGFQLLDLQDFTGQGVALVGMLNPFMEEKKFVKKYSLRKKWQGFCCDAAVLAELDSFVFTENTPVNIPVKLRYMQPDTLCSAAVRWSFGNESGELVLPEISSGLTNAGIISLSAPSSGKYTLSVQLINNGKLLSENSYDIYVFPKAEPELHICEPSVQGSSCVYIVSDVKTAQQLLENGEKVLLIPGSLPESVKGFYCTDFWCYTMFRTISESMGKEIPVGTLGLNIISSHPALKYTYSSFYSTPQWYSIVSASDCAVLDRTDEGFQPIVSVNDNFERCRKLGLLYEARSSNGRLMVCTSRLYDIADKPEVQALLKGIIEYMHSDSFAPEFEYSLNDLGL